METETSKNASQNVNISYDVFDADYDDGDKTPTMWNNDVPKFGDVKKTQIYDARRSDVNTDDATHDVTMTRDDVTDSDSDTDTIILESDEDLDSVQTEVIVNPPAEMISPLRSLDNLQLSADPDDCSRNIKENIALKTDTDSRFYKTSDDSDFESEKQSRFFGESTNSNLKMDNVFKMPKPVEKKKQKVKKRQLKFQNFLEVPTVNTDQVMIASAESDLSCFLSRDMTSQGVSKYQQIRLERESSKPMRRLRRYNSEPYRQTPNCMLKNHWRTSVIVRKSSPSRKSLPAKKEETNGFNHIWFKPGGNHPLLKMDSEHFPKFLKRRIQRQAKLEKSGGNGNSIERSGEVVRRPCYHCGCPGNHMPRFMRKRLLRKIKTDLSSNENAENYLKYPPNLSLNFGTNKPDTESEKEQKYVISGNDVMNTGSGSDLEARISRMRSSLLSRQTRMEVLERVMYRRKPKGVFIASLMKPKHKMFKPKYR